MHPRSRFLQTYRKRTSKHKQSAAMAKIAENQDWANASAEQVAAVDAEIAEEYATEPPVYSSEVSGARFLPELPTPELVSGPVTPVGSGYGTWGGHERHMQHMKDLQTDGADLLLQGACTSKREALLVEEQWALVERHKRWFKSQADHLEAAAVQTWSRPVRG